MRQRDHVGDGRSGLARAPEPRNGRRSRQARADHEGLTAGTDFDTDLLFYTCVLRYLGTSPSAPGKQRFEVEAADITAEFLTGHAYGVRETDPVWEVLAVHTSPGIAERRVTAIIVNERFGF